MIVISNKLQKLRRPALKRFFSTDCLGYSILYGCIYALSAGCSHAAQYGLHAILKAMNDGEYNYQDDVLEYGKKAKIIKKMFTDKVVPISVNYPFFFKPIQDGMDRPKTELAYRVPASKFTRRSIETGSEMIDLQGLDTTIDWKNTGDNSYDGEKLKLLVHDESGKWERPDNILNNWRVTKTTLRLGSRIVGKCMMGSTSNALDKGGANFKKLYNDSDVTQRNANGQTRSGLYSLFIPMEWNYEGYIDSYGFPVFNTPKKEIVGPLGDAITQGVIEYWDNEVEGLKQDQDGLNEFYRQFPRQELLKRRRNWICVL